MTGQIVFFSALGVMAIIVFILLVKNRKKKGQKTDTMPNDPTRVSCKGWTTYKVVF